MSNKTYDTLKWVAQYFLPGLGTLYFALSTIWGLPYGEQVVGSIAAIDTFLGCLLGISTATYKKSGMDGVIELDKSEEVDRYSFVFTRPFNELSESDTVTFKVKK